MKRHNLTIALLLFLNSFSACVLALEPPPPEERITLRSSDDYYQRLKFALSLGNQNFDETLIEWANARLQSGSVTAPPPAWRGLPTTGNVKVFALLIDFADYTHKDSAGTINGQLFGNGISSQYPYESLRNFYTRSSYNQLNLSGSTLGWYKTPYSRSSIANTGAGREKLIKEALNYFDRTGHDFSQYDNDKDGDIDYFVVIWTGPVGKWSSFWWGYQTWFSDSSYRLDGKTLTKYSWQWERYSSNSAFTPLVVIHETGHALGLPDFYDYTGDDPPFGGAGGLDMMDSNWGDHNAFSKWMLGWITPQIIASGSHDITLRASGDHKDAVVIMPNASPSSLFSEYFIVQNRTRVGNDKNHPADGMLIWHVDARLDKNGYSFLYNNSYTPHKLLRLMEADGLEEIEKNRRADSGDYYIPGRSFTPSSSPNSKRYDGSRTGVSVTGLSSPGSSMTATFSIEGTEPKSKIFNISNNGDADLVVSSIKSQTTASWLSVSPTTFTVPPRGSKQVTATVNPALVPQGSNRVRLLVSSNDLLNTPYSQGVYVNATGTIGAAAFIDSDDDWYPDQEEQQAGSDPYDANSYPGSMLFTSQSDCAEVNGTVTVANKTYTGTSSCHASQTLLTSGVVAIGTAAASADVTFSAGDRIILNPNFRVFPGSDFRAMVVAANAARSTQAPEDITAIRPRMAVQAAETAPPKRLTFEQLPMRLRERLAGLVPADTLFRADGQGQRIVFASDAALDYRDVNAVTDVYLYDQQADQLYLVSMGLTGQAGNGPSLEPAINGDGSLVVFASYATDLTQDAPSGHSEIYLYDPSLQQLQRISTETAKSEWGDARRPVIATALPRVAYDQIMEDQDIRKIRLLDLAWPGQGIQTLETPTGANLHHPVIRSDGAYLGYLEGSLIGEAQGCRIWTRDFETGERNSVDCPESLLLSSDPSTRLLEAVVERELGER